MSRAPLRLGTRRSPMAVAQSRGIASAITARTGREVELVGIASAGDQNAEPLTQIGGTGVFVSALRISRLAGDVDIAVHSLKDLPVGPAERIALAAVPERDDPRDALVGQNGAKLADLPAGARIGTGSPRRAAQLLMLRPDVHPVPIRGNADTRLGKVSSGEVDAVVLAYAGLVRISRLDAVTQVFETEEMMPAPGQGALAVECLASRPDLAASLHEVNDEPSRAATDAERSLLAALQAGCSAPIGAYAAAAAGTNALRLDAIVAAPGGGEALRASAEGPAERAAALGRQLAAELLSRGAHRYTDVPEWHQHDGDDAT